MIVDPNGVGRSRKRLNATLEATNGELYDPEQRAREIWRDRKVVASENETRGDTYPRDACVGFCGTGRPMLLGNDSGHELHRHHSLSQCNLS